MFKRTIGTDVDEDIPMYGDLGYLGIYDYHANSIIPIKASKNNGVSIQESLRKAFA